MCVQANGPEIATLRTECPTDGIHPDEAARLDALARYDILDTAPEEAFGDLAALAARLCGAPIALVSLVDAGRQWFKAAVGIEAAETSRDASFCAHAIRQPGLFVVPDARVDERFATNPLVTGDPGIRFYAGSPLVTPDGFGLGTLCVIDRVPRDLSPEQAEALRALGRQVVSQLELRLRVAELRQAVVDNTRAEAALRASEARKAAILETALDCIVTIDHEGLVLEFNPAAEQTFGYTLAVALGRPLADLIIPPELREAHRRGMARYLASGRAVVLGKRIEVAAMHKDGSTFPAELAITAIRGQGPPVFTAHLRDISERTRAQEALRRSEERFALAVRGSTDGLWDWTVATGEVYFSPRFKELLGHEDHELEDRFSTFESRLHPEDRDRVLRAVADHLERRAPYDVEYRLRTKGGEYCWFQARGQAVWDGGGKATRMAGSLGDITERRKAQEELARANGELEARVRARTADLNGVNLALQAEIAERKHAEDSARQAETKYRGIFENSVEGIFQTDPEGRFLGANPALAAIYGYASPEEMIAGVNDVGRQLYVDPDRRDEFVRLIREHDRLSDFESRIRRKDGGVIWVAEHARAVRGAGGEVVHYEGTVQDITGRKRAEGEILGLNVKLERRLERIDALRQVDRAISASLDLGLTLGVVLDQVLAQLGVHAAAILSCDPRTCTLQYAAGKGFRTDGITESSLRLGEGYAGEAALERRPVHVDDLRDPRSSFVRAHLLAGEGFVAYRAVPLVARGQIKGILEVFHRAPLSPDREWLGFFEALAGQAAIAVDNASLFQDLQRSNVDLTLAYDATIEGWSRALDLRDKETEGHTRRVTEMTLKLARAMGMDEVSLGHIRRGALLHDIGKMGIPDGILLKPGPLTDEEWEVMRRHPTYALEMLAPIAFLRPALDIPHAHHEKWDGTGYPRGLAGEGIPLPSRIFAAVDIWDALRSDRPYRRGWPEAKVLDHIRSLSGTHLDPDVVSAFLRIIPSHPAGALAPHIASTALAPA